eukprot:2990001-Prymnesium_polylepis.1
MSALIIARSLAVRRAAQPAQRVFLFFQITITHHQDAGQGGACAGNGKWAKRVQDPGMKGHVTQVSVRSSLGSLLSHS